MSAFDKIIGYADIKLELERYSDVLKNIERYKKLGVTLPRGILLDGQPGIGKTLMAKCFIEECGCKSYILRKDKPDGDFVNEIRSTFEKAKADNNAIVFLDDMDKFANEDDEHRDADEYVTVQSCIDECRDTGIFVLATVNDSNCLPDSLKRAGRFDKVIEMRYPRGEDARKIVEHYLSQKKIIGDIDIEEISRLMEGHSCAELETVINEAGIYAGFEKRERIEQKDIIRACMRMIFEAPESIDSCDERNEKRVAIHEAGHAVVAEALNPGSVSLVSINHYSGEKQGVVLIERPDDYYTSIIARENEIMQKLGGKAATELVLGMADMGCTNDLRIAFRYAIELVDDNCAYGFDAFEGSSSSQHLCENRDRAVAKKMDEYYTKAKQILLNNRELLDAITKALIDRKTLTQKDIEEIKNRYTEGKIAS